MRFSAWTEVASGPWTKIGGTTHTNIDTHFFSLCAAHAVVRSVVPGTISVQFVRAIFDASTENITGGHVVEYASSERCAPGS